MNHQKISAKKKPTNFNKTLLPFHLLQHPPQIENLGGFLQGFGIKTSCKDGFFKPPTLNLSTLLGHRSIPHGIQHLNHWRPLETAGICREVVVLPWKPEAFEILEGWCCWCWFGWFAWFLLVFVGWLVCLVWFGWWNSHFWQFWPWKDVCCWVCFDGYFKEWFVFWRNFGRFPFHSFKLRGYATHEKWFKEEKLHSRFFCKILVTFFVKVSIHLQKELEIMRVRCSKLVSYHTPFVASS